MIAAGAGCQAAPEVGFSGEIRIERMKTEQGGHMMRDIEVSHPPSGEVMGGEHRCGFSGAW